MYRSTMTAERQKYCIMGIDTPQGMNSFPTCPLIAEIPINALKLLSMDSKQAHRLDKSRTSFFLK
jgi:hypothetical protein